ncbi:MAG: hypothetical protein HC893_13135 [Chloroflexaceae bacterium]|nr:hypothetical protein [Chloroflexaceae bacterium]
MTDPALRDRFDFAAHEELEHERAELLEEIKAPFRYNVCRWLQYSGSGTGQYAQVSGNC